MKLFFYQGEYPNFGDELSSWLMPKVFPNFFDDDAGKLFLGIGSILYNDFPPKAVKIVYGSGFGGYKPAPEINESWQIFCVRGPRTAQILGLSQNLVVADSAIVISDFRPPSQATAKISFMPHFESSVRGHWEQACRIAGINFIDPRANVTKVLDEIQSSKMIITEAMHGAIVADALRVPWVPVRPFHPMHRMKWADWAEALDVQIRFQTLFPSSIKEAGLFVRKKDTYLLESPKLKSALRLADQALLPVTARFLKQLCKVEPTLSRDTNLRRAQDRLLEISETIKKTYPN